MKDLYRKPEAELLKFAPAENLAADNPSWFEDENDEQIGQG